MNPVWPTDLWFGEEDTPELVDGVRLNVGVDVTSVLVSGRQL